MDHAQLHKALTATLYYWQSCGIDILSKDPTREAQEQADIQACAYLQEPEPSVQPLNTPSVSVQNQQEITPKQQRVSPSPALSIDSPVKSILSNTPIKTIPIEKREAMMAELEKEITHCQRCQLVGFRQRTVLGVGSLQAPVVFVGEAPGADEDREGIPFVGAAGQLLDKMLHSIGFIRQDIYIANVLKCRPPGNRNPLPNEVEQCQGYLVRQLEIIQPQAIFVMGKFAISTLLGRNDPVGRIRGQVYQWRKIPVIASYHPAYYLRQPVQKKAAWHDLLLLQKTLKKQ
ncbi:MAG: uracil-DNA glycosylase [Magnetococcales bacterium]|nr:uracil-DNA glycosylase [Magnetococcales bacterium]